MADRPVIVGIGNTWRGDDGVGPWVADEMARRGWPSIVHGGDGAGLIDLFATHPALILVDASRSGAAPGTISHFDAVAAPLPAAFFHYSTHRFGLAEAVETARALGALPRHLEVYAIEGADFSAGQGLSAGVRQSAAAVIGRIVTGLSRKQASSWRAMEE